MRVGELVQVTRVLPILTDSTEEPGIATVETVGFVTTVTDGYVTLTQDRCVDADHKSPVISIPLPTILRSQLLAPGRKRATRKVRKASKGSKVSKPRGPRGPYKKKAAKEASENATD